ncbi:MAG: hypothetical protein QOE45_2879 [Frankiaceae bacterium]|jgi:hypothetical protein|nr:hypothetical protein [Frankiaceae bacterium]
MKRTLNLKRETLADLTVDELAAVVGAQALSGATCPLQPCLSAQPRCSWSCP